MALLSGSFACLAWASFGVARDLALPGPLEAKLSASAAAYDRTLPGRARGKGRGLCARLVVGKFEAFAHVVASRPSSPYVRLNDRALDQAEFDDPAAYRDRHRVSLDLKWRHNLSEVASVSARAYDDLTAESYRLQQRAFFGCFEPFAPHAGWAACCSSIWTGPAIASS